MKIHIRVTELIDKPKIWVRFTLRNHQILERVLPLRSNICDKLSYISR